MSKSKICFLVTDAISFNVLCRGQLEYFRDNADIDITLICGGTQEQLSILAQRKIGKLINAKFERKPSLFKDIRVLIFLTFYFLFNRFDLVVYSTPKALLLGSIASCLTFQKKRIALIRGRAYENFSGKKRKIYGFLDRICLFISHKVIFISKSLKEVYQSENLIKNNKAFLLGAGSSNGVNTCKYKPKEGLEVAVKNDLVNSHTNIFKVLMIGRICPDKGIYDLAEILENVKQKNLQVLMVGDIEDNASEIIVETLKQKYSFFKHVTHTNDVVQYFHQADLHLFLSHREGFGNVAIEAASCGVPTFAYDVVGVKDSVINGVNGQRFVFKDTFSVAEAINQAATDPNFQERYSSARNWTIQNFDQRKVWQNYLNFYLKSLS